VPIENADYAERVARVAEEMYQLLDQLHKKTSDPVTNRSISSIHPGETLEPKVVTDVMISKGVCDGKEPIQEAA
jgi:hypothetical protein